MLDGQPVAGPVVTCNILSQPCFEKNILTFFLHDSFPRQCVLKELADVLGTAWTRVLELLAHGNLSFNEPTSGMAFEAFCHHALSLHSVRLVTCPVGKGRVVQSGKLLPQKLQKRTHSSLQEHRNGTLYTVGTHGQASKSGCRPVVLPERQ